MFPSLSARDKVAEREGFEPPVPFSITGFQDQRLQPLGHLSMSEPALLIITDHCSFVNHFLKIIRFFFATFQFTLGIKAEYVRTAVLNLPTASHHPKVESKRFWNKPSLPGRPPQADSALCSRHNGEAERSHQKDQKRFYGSPRFTAQET